MYLTFWSSGKKLRSNNCRVDSQMWQFNSKNDVYKKLYLQAILTKLLIILWFIHAIL
ncbi:hypothetical protein Hanom_Chr04g00291411 [Helianthus anomalus]